jgi:PAS domain S-box-containing protein
VTAGSPAAGEPWAAWRLRDSPELLETIVTCAPVGFGLLDPAMRFVRANESLAAIGGLSADDLIGRRPHEVLPEPWGDGLAGPFRRVLDSGEPIDDVEIAGPTTDEPDREHAWVASSYPVRHDGEVVGVGVFLTDISERARAERILRLLFEVGEALDATLGVEERLGRLAVLVVPTLADFCTIETIDATGTARAVARAALVEEGPWHEPDQGPDPERQIVAPLRARGRDLGSLTLGMGPSGRRYDDDDRALAAQLGRRAGLAVDNARLYEDQRRIASTLQRSLLPPALPDIPGLEVAARYSPMGDGTEVGGDFYDLFAAGSSWAAVIGDVCGKGAPAAALTSLVRHGLRGLGRGDPSPMRALSELNDAIVAERGLDARFSTAAYARLAIDGAAIAVTSASAGHPLPLIVRAGGRVEGLGRAGTLLGPFAEVSLHEATAVLAPGDALVLHTDGVTEARRDGVMFGDERLSILLSGLAGRPADEIAGAVEEAVVRHHGGPLEDDLALLVLRVRR